MLRFQLFMLEKSNTKVIEISLMLVTENHEIFSISTNDIENLNTCIEKVEIRLSVQILVIQV